MSKKESKLNDAQLLRIKAEKLLEKEKNKKETPPFEADLKKLLHELQVHQIELEIQNEELQLSNDALETALKKYTMLYDFAPTGYFTLDADGIIVDLNFTGAEILNEKRFTLENSNFKIFVSEGFRIEFRKFLTKVFNGKIKESCISNLSLTNGTLRTVYIEGIAISEDKKCLLSVVDITSFKQQIFP